MSSQSLHFGDLHQEAKVFCFAPSISHDRTRIPGSQRQDPARSGDRARGASPAEASATKRLVFGVEVNQACKVKTIISYNMCMNVREIKVSKSCLLPESMASKIKGFMFLSYSYRSLELPTTCTAHGLAFCQGPQKKDLVQSVIE